MEGRRIYVKHPSYSNELTHYQIQGAKHGVRRWQYEDGSLTPEGRIHYGVGPARGEKVDAKYVNGDRTLNLRGRVHYRTLNKYSSLSDDDIRENSARLQLQKNNEDLKKQTSTSYRVASKISNVAEEITINGLKKAGEKIINNFIDTSVSKLLKSTDKEEVKRAREIAEKLAGMSSKEIGAWNTRSNAEKEAYERLTGTKIPSDYKYSDLTDKDKEAIRNGQKRDEQKNKDNPPSKSTETKAKEAKSGGSKESSQKNSSEVSEKQTKTENPEQYVNKKTPVMKELEDKPAKSENAEKYVNKKSPVLKELEEKPLMRQRITSEEISKPLVRVHRVDLDEDDKKKKKG